MPIYEYLCDDCAARFERYVRAWGEPVSCPACHSAAVAKQPSRFALKGAAAEPAPARGGACCGGGCGCAH
jgi:putative FmdB family regulatory protein